MARKSTKSAVTSEATVENTVASTIMAEEESVKEETVIAKESLKDSDVIEVMSLISHVSYQDSHTNDWFEWEDMGHIEPMDFATIKNMWRNHKGYFRNLYLKPLDERVIKQFGLESTMRKYELLLDAKNYNRSNIESVVEALKSVPSGTRYAVMIRIREMIKNGDITDFMVIRTLERELDTDFTSSL